MGYRYLNQETDEIRNAIEDTLKQIKTNREARYALIEQDKKLRQQLLHTMELMDIVDGDSLISNDLGIKAIIYQNVHAKVTQDALLQAGVSESLIEKAKEIYSKGRPSMHQVVRIQDYPSAWGSKYINNKG